MGGDLDVWIQGWLEIPFTAKIVNKLCEEGHNPTVEKQLNLVTFLWTVSYYHEYVDLFIIGSEPSLANLQLTVRLSLVVQQSDYLRTK